MLQDHLNSLSPLNSPVSGHHISNTRTGWVQVCWPQSSKVIFRAILFPWPQSAHDVSVAKVLLWPFYKGQAILEPPSHPLNHCKKPGWCFQMQRVKGKYKPLLSLKPFPLNQVAGNLGHQSGMRQGQYKQNTSSLGHTSWSIMETLSQVASLMCSPPSTRPW